MRFFEELYSRVVLNAGALDITFGDDGRVLTDIGPGRSDTNDFGSDIAAYQTDGKVIVAGWSYRPATDNDFVVARYNTDGSLDTSFGKDGIVMIDFGGSETAYGVAVDGNDNVLVGGQSWADTTGLDFAVARLTSKGVLNDLIRLEIDGDDAASDGTPGVTDLAGNHIDGGDHTSVIDLRSLSLVAEMLTKAEALGLNTGAANNLTAKLDAALQLLDVETPNDQGIVAKLESFIKGVNHWYDKGDISLADRDHLIDDTEFIILGLSLV